MTDIYAKGVKFQQAGNMRPKAQALMQHRFLNRSKRGLEMRRIHAVPEAQEALRWEMT